MRLPWRTIAAGPARARPVGERDRPGRTGGNPSTDVVADSSPLVTVPDTALDRLDAPVLPSLPELPGPARGAADPALPAGRAARRR